RARDTLSTRTMNKVNKVVLSGVLGYVFLLAGCSKSGPGGTISPACNAPQISCGSACVNATTDPQNCGACGKKCSSGEMCQGGSCQCQGGLLSCNGMCISPDAANCAGCNLACQPGEVCNAGVCGTTCTDGKTQCPGGSCVTTNG